ncbi:hypothetical protein H5410_059171 [Solanum commersonii]|uniref:Uncharacterized protein n=1 Tax=Solanum commersonii TaxID=4109 RepID=A0A9J5W1P2_SOLCO|nr:hypothetical protein H5410_059171 [Solanum commersonii]
MDVRYDLINGFSWSQWAHMCIFKFKQATKQEKSDFTDFSCVIVHLVLTNNREHFQVQASPKKKILDFTDFCVL